MLFADIAGQPHYSWDSRDHRLRIECDELRRPAQVYLLEKASAETWANTTATEVLIEETIFGDDSAYGPANPKNNNFLTRPYIQRDGGGQVVFNSYDFKGNPLSSTQTLAQDYKNVVDWEDDPEDVLEDETFTNSITYDALNRVKSKTTPDNSEFLPYYNDAGLLDAVDVKIKGATPATSFIDNIDYNARGQRTKVEKTNYQLVQNSFS